jgi:hypothetical protein
MANLNLKANPTFRQKVGIPVHGGDPVDVSFEFKHRTKPDFDAFQKELFAKTAAATSPEELRQVDVWYVLQVAVAWELTDAFGEASINELFDNYQGAAGAIAEQYTLSLMQVKLGNFGERRARSTNQSPTPLN